MPPTSIDLGHLVFSLSVCQQKLLHWPYLLIGNYVKTFIFHISIPCDKTFLLVTSSRSNIKVTDFERMAIVGA